AGYFDSAGGKQANNIAQWNGSSWSPLGLGTDDAICSLCVYGGNLYAGGFFTHAGGVPANNIAEWNGSSWTALGSGVNGSVDALMIYNSNLIAGGKFNTAGGNPANYIATWNGSAWSALGTGINIGNNGGVFGFAIYNSILYVGGAFNNAGGLPENNIAAWDGSKWYKIWGGIISGHPDTGGVLSLAVYNGALYAGGQFDTAGGKPENNIAEYTGVAGIKEIADNSGISIYPNPCSDRLVVQNQGTGEIEMMSLYNTLGALVWQSRSVVLQSTEIPVTGVAQGIYFLQFELSDGSTLVKKVEVIK
ncbi:MAG: T9SS type A sorting domain-containing protein, partial [Bacteroidia bacterium]|nr:T9SS type A sorting domain-containing protein [Bacteroidia bacterium]